MDDEHFKIEIQKKIAEAKKAMAAKGRNYDGLGNAIEREKLEGPDFGPRNDIEYRKIIKEIRKFGDHDDSK